MFTARADKPPNEMLRACIIRLAENERIADLFLYSRRDVALDFFLLILVVKSFFLFFFFFLLVAYGQALTLY